MASIKNLGVMPAFASDFVTDDAIEGTPNCCNVIVFSGGSSGYWGRGVNVHEAITNSEWVGKEDGMLVCMCDAGAYIDDHGKLCHEARSTVYAGIVTVSKGGKYDIAIRKEVQANA